MVPMLVAFAAQLFTLEGRIVPASRGAATVHATSSPFTSSTLVNVDGAFRFKQLAPGSYTVSVNIPGRGEVRQTVVLGPATADSKRRVRVQLAAAGEAVQRESAHLVSSKELSVPDRARRAYSDAMKKLERRDVLGATKDLERALEMAPGFAAAWNHLGTIAYQTRHFEEAERYFRAALDADSEMYEPLVNLGGVLINNRKLDEAWQLNVRAVLTRPRDALAQSQLGMTYLYLGKLDLSEKHLLEAIAIDPAHFSHPQIHLAEVYFRRKDVAKCAAQLEDFIARHPDDPTVPRIREMLGKLLAADERR
jgi:tetratricopeptide (TPR) repeat protein